MSKQLNRIRSLISDIEEIQKKGQQPRSIGFEVPVASATPPSSPLVSTAPPPTPAPEMVQVQPIGPISEPTPLFLAPPVQTPRVEAARVDSLPVTPGGRVVMQLTGNIVLALEVEGMNEILEIRRVSSPQNCIEIRFADGKAVHLPLKSVA